MEIDRIDWNSYTCGCGRPAGHLANFLRTIISATSDSYFLPSLSGHVERAPLLFEVTPVAVSVMVAALGEELQPAARHELLNTIWRCLCGEDEELDAACANAARTGLWQLYRDAAAPSRAEVTILNLLDSDRARFHNFIRQIESPPKWLSDLIERSAEFDG
ncbi:hypothetical protein [Kitasatospora paracochleata]|uniref:Uncharacterized protein n=1 Tax=Kitasatospora paracochleata TaxID=58354 RepID=A0ABT1JB29_9ACTN|nr:hypothetical protein [Kitasatospora paracochleata]MCP2314652.1 hypothetical protein [Kitasatospora paracochleata]